MAERLIHPLWTDGVVCESSGRRAAPTGSTGVAACVGSRVRAVPQLHGAAARPSPTASRVAIVRISGLFAGGGEILR